MVIKKEAIKYCSIDCIALHDVLEDFNDLIFKQFQVNIHQSLTLPSLTLRNYKTPQKTS